MLLENSARFVVPFEPRRLDRLIYATAPVAECGLTTEHVVRTLLARNSDNRPARETFVDYLANAIERGEWALTPNGIGVSRAGVMIDGQHRLLAIEKAGYPSLPILIVGGLDPDAAKAIDTGLKRTIADLMHFAFGLPEVSSAMIAVIRSWAENTAIAKKSLRVAPSDVFEWYMTIRPALDRVMAVPGSRRLAAPVLAACVHRLHKVPGDDRPLLFLERLLSGANLDERSPILVLRKWLDDSRSQAGQEITTERFLRTCSALVSYLRGETIAKLFIKEESIDLLTVANPPRYRMPGR